MIVRKEDWPERLKSYLQEAATRSFSWKDFNCCTFACGGIGAMTGNDPAKLFPTAKVQGRKSAYATLKKFSGGGVLETARKITAELGLEEIPPKKAGRGDIVFIETEDGGALGLVDLSGVYAVVLQPGGGFGRHAAADCKAAWRVA